jgi:hypothetical protein
MKNHYICVYLNFFLFNQFSDTVDRQSEVDSRYKAKNIKNHKADILKFILTYQVVRDSKYSCSNRVKYRPDPILGFVLFDNSLRRMNFI